MDLTSGQESDMLSVSTPPGVADALAGSGEQLVSASVDVAYIQIADALVVLHGGVAYTI
jgi:hypothetical protein